MNASTWYNVKVKYTKQLDDGRLKRVTEPYLIDSVSFTDAEARFYEEIGQSILGDYTITGIAKKDYMDIFYYDDADEWYVCRLTYVSIDEDDGENSKKIKCNFLVTANSVKEACERIDESLKDMMASYEITGVAVTTITEVLPYTPDSSREIDRRPIEETADTKVTVENEEVAEEKTDDVSTDEEADVEFKDEMEEKE